VSPHKKFRKISHKQVFWGKNMQREQVKMLKNPYPKKQRKPKKTNIKWFLKFDNRTRKQEKKKGKWGLAR